MKELRHTTTVTVPDDMFASAELLTKVRPIVEKFAADMAEAVGKDHVKHAVEMLTPRKKAKPATKPVAVKAA